MDKEKGDYKEVPGDLNPLEPSIAYEYFEAGKDELAAHYFQIWINEYDLEYRRIEIKRKGLGAAYCDMATCLMTVDRVRYLNKCIHSFLEGISLNPDVTPVASQNLGILMRAVLYVKSSGPWQFTEDEMKQGTWQSQAKDGWDSFKRNSYKTAFNIYSRSIQIICGGKSIDDTLYEEALSKGTKCLPLIHSYTFAKFGYECDEDTKHVPEDILKILLKIHEADKFFNFTRFQVPTPPKIKKESTPDSRCFIATAVCGSVDSEELITLRAFRDKILLQSKIGRSFINYYYKLSPSLAKFISEREKIRAYLRIALIVPLVKIAENIMLRGKKEL